MFKGIFGGLFDFDGDGRLCAAEQAAELMFLEALLHEQDEPVDAEFDILDDD